MRAFVVSVVAGLLAGCGSTRGPAVRYYKLDIPSAPTPAGPSVPVALRIEPFRTASLLRQDRIVYRPSPVEVGFYEYHRWAEPPTDTVTKALADQLTRRRLFQSVAISDGAERAEYVLRGSIDRLQEVDYKGAVKAQVTISVELEDPLRREKNLVERCIFRVCGQEERCAGGCRSHGSGFAAEYRATGEGRRGVCTGQPAWGAVVCRDFVTLICTSSPDNCEF